jgi:hypothetical protein
MRQAPARADISPSRTRAACVEQRPVGRTGAPRDDVEAISDDDDAPMVTAGGACAASCMRAGAPVIASPSAIRQPQVVKSTALFSSSSRDAAVPDQARTGSKRPAVAAESTHHPQPGVTGRKGSVVEVFEGHQGQDPVLDIDDLDSLFAL